MQKLVATGLLFTLTLYPQTDSQEVRVSSRPYTGFRLRTESNLVQVNVVVRDRQGRAVSGLTQASFKLFEEGKPREIASFAVETTSAPNAAKAPPSLMSPSISPTDIPRPAAPAPLHFIAMYFDDFTTAAPELAFTKNAAKKFVQQNLSPNDRMAIVTASQGRITKDYSNDKAQLAEAIDKVATHAKFSQTDSPGCPRITPYDAYKMVVLMDEDAIHSAITELGICGLAPPADAPARPRLPGATNRADPNRMNVLNQAQQIWEHVVMISQNSLAALSAAIGELYRMPGPKTPGSRTLLLVSSGFLTGTLERERDQVVDQAVRASVVINALDAKGLFTAPPGRPPGEPQETTDTPIEVYIQETLNAVDRIEEPSGILSNLAASTGGLYFHHNNGFSEGFRELGATPETTYLLGFRPDEATLNGKYHKLKVTLAAATTNSIQARPGYFANAKAAGSDDPGETEIDKQVTGPQILKDLNATVSYVPGPKTANGLTPLKIQMHVDLKGVEFPEKDARHLQKLSFVFALLDKDGAIVSAREGVMEFSLTQPRFEAIMQSGINAALTLEAPPGIYKLRTVALEGVHSKLATLSYAIKVP